MNAMELADWLIAFTQDVADYEEKWIKDSATMLRKQQKEIEALKTELRLIDELVTGKAQEK
jgi:hypothetical protein